jgi:protein-disulfide isomerase
MRHSRLLAAFLLFSTSACRQPASSPATDEKQASPSAAALDLMRYEVRLVGDEYALGGQHPLVTIVLFSNYACPPCRKTWQVMRNLLEDYKDDIRVVYRSVHIPGYKANDEAVDAVYAAGAQGKFWEMHWRLFDHSDDYSRPVLEAHAKALGLDLERFGKDLDQGISTGRRLADQRVQRELGVFAGPAAFANGVLVLGHRPEDVWHVLIDQEILRAKNDLANGVLRPDLYANMQKSARKGPIVVEADERKALPGQGIKGGAVEEKVTIVAPDASKRYRIEVDRSHGIGPADAPVEIVEFTDFQCPYCKKGNNGVFAELRKKYGKELRWSIAHLPLPMHAGARPAAMAANAAAQQGAFWPYHERLFAETRPFTRETFLALAGELGLDTAKFANDYASQGTLASVQADLETAAKLGISSTPVLFVNGRMIEGATGIETYERLIDEELAAAKVLLAQGKARSEIHAALMADAIDREHYPNPNAKALSPIPPGGE